MSTSDLSSLDDSLPEDSDHANRQIRFGMFALKMGMLNREQYAREMESWIAARTPSFSQWLVDRRQLTAEQVEQIERAMHAELAASADNSVDSLPSGLESGVEWSDRQDSHSKESTGADGKRPRSDTEPNSQQGGGEGNETSLNSTVGRRTYRERSQQELLAEHERQLKSTFVIRHKLGQGGQGIVWLAHDTRLKRDVAIKQLRPELAEDRSLRQRLDQEARIISSLEHPGIVPVYGVGQFGTEQPFYAMRLIEGKTLANAIKQELRIGFPANQDSKGEGNIGRIAYERYLRKYLSHFIAACNAVAYAHSRGVLHRDLKPANIMLGQFGETLVVDWGLAKACLTPTVAFDDTTIDGAVRTSTAERFDGMVDPTMEGGYVGTPPYMSPEQACGQVSRFGVATDVFGLGATLYSLLVGKAPYEGPAEDATRLKAANHQLVSARRRNPLVPAPLSAVCDRAMAYEPAQRYASAIDLRQEIEAWLADEPVQALPDSSTQKLARWGRAHRGVVRTAIASLVLFTVTLAVAAYRLRQQQSQTQRNFEQARSLMLGVIDLLQLTPVEIMDSPSVMDKRAKAMESATQAAKFLHQFAPHDLDVNLRKIQAQHYQANGLRLQGNLQNAAQLLADALQTHDEIVSQIDDERRGECRSQFLEVLRILALVQGEAGEISEAIETLTRAIESSREWLESKQQRLTPEMLGNPAQSQEVFGSTAQIWPKFYVQGVVARALAERGALRLVLRDQMGAREDLISARDYYVEIVQADDASSTRFGKVLDEFLLCLIHSQLAMLADQEGDVEEATRYHELAARRADELDPEGSLVDRDHLNIRAVLRLAQAKFWLAHQMRHDEALINLGYTIESWSILAREHTTAVQYHAQLAAAHCTLAKQLMVDPEQRQRAEEMLHAARATLINQLNRVPEVVQLYGLQAETMLALSQLEELKGQAAPAERYREQARVMILEAVKRSPRNRDYQNLQQMIDPATRSEELAK